MNRVGFSKDLLALQHGVSVLVSENLSAFSNAGQRIDAQFGVAEFRRSQANKLRRARKTVSRQQLRRYRIHQAFGGIPPGPEADRVPGRGICIPRSSLVPFDLDIFSFLHRRETRPGKWHWIWRQECAAILGLIPDPPVPDACRLGQINSLPLTRLFRAFDATVEAIDTTLDMPLAEEFLLLVWLLCNRTAHKLEPIVTEFQRLPWAYSSIAADGSYGGRAVAAERFTEDVIPRVTAALVVVKENATIVSAAFELLPSLLGATAGKSPEDDNSAREQSVAATTTEGRADTKQICFYEKGMGWIIQLDDFTFSFPSHRGFRIIHDLLLKPDSPIPVTILDGLNVPTDIRAEGNPTTDDVEADGSARDEDENRRRVKQPPMRRIVRNSDGRFETPDEKKCRQRVGKAIKNALDLIEKELPWLGSHLRSRVEGHSSSAPRYHSDPSLTWILR